MEIETFATTTGRHPTMVLNRIDVERVAARELATYRARCALNARARQINLAREQRAA